MRAALAVVVTVACGVGCSDPDPVLSKGPSMGRACGAGPVATITETPQGTAADFKAAYADLAVDTIGITLIPQASSSVTVTSCGLTYTPVTTTESWILQIDAQKLGTFTVEDELVTAFASTLRDMSGSVTIDGYDADAQTVCGSVDLMADNGGYLRGTFVADIYCTDE